MDKPNRHDRDDRLLLENEQQASDGQKCLCYTKVDMPSITIIVPVYNALPYLATCIESLQNQSYSDIEIILVDDGSTDGSGSLCDSFAASDNRIHVIHTENRGPSVARNSGLAIAVSDVIMFVDSDDWLEQNATEVVATFMAKNSHVDASMIGYFRGINTTDEVAYTLPTSTSVVTFRDIEDRYLSVEDHKPIIRYDWIFALRRDLLETNDIRFDKDSFIYEDVSFTLEALSKACAIGIIDRPLYHYRMTPGSITNFVGYRENFPAATRAMVTAAKKYCTPGARLDAFCLYHLSGCMNNACLRECGFMEKVRDVRFYWKEIRTYITDDSIPLLPRRIRMIVSVPFLRGMRLFPILYTAYTTLAQSVKRHKATVSQKDVITEAQLHPDQHPIDRIRCALPRQQEGDS